MEKTLVYQIKKKFLYFLNSKLPKLKKKTWINVYFLFLIDFFLEDLMKKRGNTENSRKFKWLNFEKLKIFWKKWKHLESYSNFWKKKDFDEKNKCFPKKLLRKQVEFPVAWKVRA